MTPLLTNTQPADNCRWCGNNGEPHTPACPMGERYQQVQRLGGVPSQTVEETERAARLQAHFGYPTVEAR